MVEGFVNLKEVCEKLKKKEPKIDLLHDVLGCGRYASVIQSSDGYFLGQRWGDIGYNDFLGEPSEEAKERTKKLFNSLDDDLKGEILFILVNKGIKLKDIGLG